mmetsp:Transcript_8370/g.9305  ORF Transcript_8370/g.9305 Transcript_8370/m.9305 type:complete len:535 (-) Transcript_8370:82-1686(-)
MKFSFALISLLFGFAATEYTGSYRTVTDTAINNPDTVSRRLDFDVLANLQGKEELTGDESIQTIAQNTKDLSNLVSLILFADPSRSNPSIEAILSSAEGRYTVFAPSNKSFQELFDFFDVNAAELALLDKQDGTLTTALKYHVIEGVYDIKDFTDGLKLVTLQGEIVTLNLSDDADSGYTVNDINIQSSDIHANNGVIHVIDGVLVPKELAEEEEPDINSIIDVAQSTDDLSNLVSLIVVADPSIADALSSPGNYTVFAPSNLSFQNLFDQFNVDAAALGELDKTTGILTTFLKYHVVQGVYKSSDIVDGLEVTTLQGEDVTLNLSDNSTTGFAVNDIEILAADVFADNGVVYVINGVLVPKELAEEEEPEAIIPESNVTEFEEPSAELSDTVVDIAIGDPDLSILVDLVVQTNLTEVLSAAGPYTIFAPSNDAFLGVLDDVSDLSVLDDETIAALLQYHVVEGLYPGSSITAGLELTTLQGETISFNKTDDGTFVNQASISAIDVVGSNGVVHIIDDVLFPEAVFKTTDEPLA